MRERINEFKIVQKDKQVLQNIKIRASLKQLDLLMNVL